MVLHRVFQLEAVGTGPSSTTPEPQQLFVDLANDMKSQGYVLVQVDTAGLSEGGLQGLVKTHFHVSSGSEVKAEQTFTDSGQQSSAGTTTRAGALSELQAVRWGGNLAQQVVAALCHGCGLPVKELLGCLDPEPPTTNAPQWGFVVGLDALSPGLEGALSRGLVTVLLSLGGARLQVQDKQTKRWQDIDLSPDIVAVVPGEVLEYATCGLVHASLHRVVLGGDRPEAQTSVFAFELTGKEEAVICPADVIRHLDNCTRSRLVPNAPKQLSELTAHGSAAAAASSQPGRKRLHDEVDGSDVDDPVDSAAAGSSAGAPARSSLDLPGPSRNSKRTMLAPGLPQPQRGSSPAALYSTVSPAAQKSRLAVTATSGGSPAASGLTFGPMDEAAMAAAAVVAQSSALMEAEAGSGGGSRGSSHGGSGACTPAPPRPSDTGAPMQQQSSKQPVAAVLSPFATAAAAVAAAPPVCNGAGSLTASRPRLLVQPPPSSSAGFSPFGASAAANAAEHAHDMLPSHSTVLSGVPSLASLSPTSPPSFKSDGHELLQRLHSIQSCQLRRHGSTRMGRTTFMDGHVQEVPPHPAHQHSDASCAEAACMVPALHTTSSEPRP